MDFIGPLPLDENYDCILSITDRLGADIRIVPTITNITTEDLATVFFDNWYCENGLPESIICDRDKLFVSLLEGVNQVIRSKNENVNRLPPRDRWLK